MRKEATITITAEGRDQGKTFHIKEWPATIAEKWILRGAFGLGRAGVEIPPEVLKLGAPAAMYFVGTQILKMPSRLALRLADELMGQVQRVEPKVTRPLVEEDIEEVATRLQLKWEVFKLHVGFSLPAALQTSGHEASGVSTPKP